ncbi:RNA-binding protein pop5 [Cryptotrichosporon argae]
MVRFKNRHLLVEFLSPSSLSAFPAPVSPSLPTDEPLADPSHDDAEGALVRVPAVPFVVPLPDETRLRAKGKDDGAGAIYRAIRGVVQDVFGDEGWGRIASSFKVIYHSPLTSLALLRVARPHVRLVWAAVTLLVSLGGAAVLPRVVAVSGTIKKLQGRATRYHRAAVAHAVAGLAGAAAKDVEDCAVREREAIEQLED